MPYIFQTDRLGFKNWDDPKDIVEMANISEDKEVMAFFPRTVSFTETATFVQRMQKNISTKGYGYYAVEILETKKMVGFIGLMDQNYDADFCPCVDIGWRLAKSEWGKGYATEGAQGCLQYAFEQLKLPEIFSVASATNLQSIKVMEKLGMKHQYNFKHPALKDCPDLYDCVLYRIANAKA